MKNMIYAIGLAMLASGFSVAAQTGAPPAPMPSKFQGVWAVDAASCSRGVSDGRIEITGKKFGFANIAHLHRVSETIVHMTTFERDENGGIEADIVLVLKDKSSLVSVAPGLNRVLYTTLFQKCSG